MRYAKKRWSEDHGDRKDPGEYIFSRARSFSMAKGWNRELGVDVARFENAACSLIRVRSSAHEIDVVADDYLSIMMPTSVGGTVQLASDFGRHAAHSGETLTLLPSDRRSRVIAPPGGAFQSLMVKLPMDTANNLLIGSASLDALLGNPVVRTSPSASNALRDLVHYVMTDLSSVTPVLRSLAGQASLEALLWEHIREFLQPSRPSVRAPTPASTRLVAAALDYIHANFREPITVAEIAKSAGVSPRRLQSAFQDVTDAGPWASVTAIRLQNARIRLLASGPSDSVTSIAFDCGFTHMGRFANLYLKTFKEKPSLTLRRRK